MAGIALLAVSPVQASADGAGSISGTVTDGASAPVFYVCVEAYDADGTLVSTTHSDAAGDYALSGLASGEYRVKFRNCGTTNNVITEFYDDAETLAEATPVSVTDGADTPGIDAQMAIGGSITGTITHSSIGPLESICVDAYDANGNRAGYDFSEADGSYRVGGLTTGDYRLRFRQCHSLSDNVAPEFYEDKGTLAEATPVSVTVGANTPGIDAELATGGSISGTVGGFAVGEPYYCLVNVVAYDSEGEIAGSATTSFFSGAYKINRLRTGEYRLQFSRGCADPANPPATALPVLTEFYDGAETLAEATPVAVTAGADTPGIDASLAPGNWISGTVTDESGAPLKGICVQAYDFDGGLQAVGGTGPSGNYRLNGLETGSYGLKFSDCFGVYVYPDEVEFYDDQESLEEATPVAVRALGDGTTGIDVQLATQGRRGPADPDPDPDPGAEDPSGNQGQGPDTPPRVDATVYRATISKVRVKGPAKAKRGKKVTFKVKITNSGNLKATGARLRVKGRGVRFDARLGKIPACTTKSVKVKLKPKSRGRAKLTFRVTTSNAGGKRVKRGIAISK